MSGSTEVVKFQNALGDSRFAAAQPLPRGSGGDNREWWNRSSSDPPYGPYWTPLADVVSAWLPTIPVLSQVRKP